MTSSTFFWVTSRAAGTTAIILASAAVGYGLVMGGRLIKGGGADRLHLHETLALSTMVAIAVHGLALLGDTWLHLSIGDVTVPFLGSYRTVVTSIGIIAGWSLVILGLAYYARRRIGLRRWKLIHRFTAVAWLMGLVHAFTEGSDAGKLWFTALIALTAAPALLLLVVRHGRMALGTARPPTQRPAPNAAPPRRAVKPLSRARA
jgi:sulfoxide reductase heme-binding subunit YedZ